MNQEPDYAELLHYTASRSCDGRARAILREGEIASLERCGCLPCRARYRLTSPLSTASLEDYKGKAFTISRDALLLSHDPAAPHLSLSEAGAALAAAGVNGLLGAFALAASRPSPVHPARLALEFSCAPLPNLYDRSRGPTRPRTVIARANATALVRNGEWVLEDRAAVTDFQRRGDSLRPELGPFPWRFSLETAREVGADPASSFWQARVVSSGGAS